MDIRELTAFVRVCETGSFTRAADDSFVTRQAMSKTIAQLEGELGTLFVRGARGVEPTGLAREIYPLARHIVEEHARIGALSAAWRADGGRGARLSLALEPGAAITLPRGLVRAYAAARPEVTVTSVTLDNDRLVEALRRGSCDAALGCPQPVEDLLFEPVYANTLTAVFSMRAPGAPRGRGAAAVAGTSFLRGRTLYGISPHNHVERQLVPYLRGLGFPVELSFECTDIALARGEMESGAGGVIVETGSARGEFGGEEYVHVPLSGRGAPVWEVGVITLPDEPLGESGLGGSGASGAACLRRRPSVAGRADVVHDFASFARDFIERRLVSGDGRADGRASRDDADAPGQAPGRAPGAASDAAPRA
ncbi:MAG: LysR family transcriptional regulator [Coriobacteriales bacterium]|jgi:DNA-binding transcriptional LysR family regulator